MRTFTFPITLLLFVILACGLFTPEEVHTPVQTLANPQATIVTPKNPPTETFISTEAIALPTETLIPATEIPIPQVSTPVPEKSKTGDCDLVCKGSQDFSLNPQVSISVSCESGPIQSSVSSWKGFEDDKGWVSSSE